MAADAPDDLDANNDGILDVATGWQLEKIEVSGVGPHIPAHGLYTGVFGKWVYMEEYNAFLGVIDPNSGDVFLYKPFALAVPEPSTAAMLLVGVLGIFASEVNRLRRRV